MIAHYPTGRQLPSPRQLDRLYPLPRETRSLDDWRRVRHFDLAEMNAGELDCEPFRVLGRLADKTDHGCREWLIGRRAAVQAERRRRAGTAR